MYGSKENGIRESHVDRGVGWAYRALYYRAANRNWCTPDIRFSDIGFVVKGVKNDSKS